MILPGGVVFSAASAQISDPTQPKNVQPRNTLRIIMAARFLTFLTIATIEGAKYTGKPITTNNSVNSQGPIRNGTASPSLLVD